MCTINLAIDDILLDQVRPSFKDESALKEWIKDQVSIVIRDFATAQAKTERRAHKHDALMGVIKDAQEIDYKTIHLKEKYEL